MTDVVASLLPTNATALERAFEQATALEPRLAPAIGDLVGVKGRELPSFLTFLLWEYGLFPLTQFVPNAYVLLLEGRAWQLERGTLASMARGLGWIGVTATVDEAPSRRTWWNSYQLALSAIPVQDSPDLERIERIAELSAPYRSDFRRGFSGYDARGMETDATKLDVTILENESGVRIKPGGPLWSFGRAYESEHTLIEGEGVSLGIWEEPTTDLPLVWDEMNYAWTTATFPWLTLSAQQRRIIMANAFAELPAPWVVLRDGGGAVIGYRRARCSRPVLPDAQGAYLFEGGRYRPDPMGEYAYVEALTDFGNGFGQRARSVTLLAGATPATSVPPGRLWLQPGEVTGGVEIAAAAIDAPLRATVRERFKFLVRF